MKTKLFFSAMLVICFISSYSTKFYSGSAGFLNSTATWWSNTAGSALPHPSNFTTANDTFIIVNNAVPTLNGAWTVSGSNSIIQIGDGTQVINFTIPVTAADKVIGTINVMNNGTLTINNATNPTLGTLSSGSTVVFGGTGNVINASYYNLTVGGSGTRTLASLSNTTVTNILTVNSGVTFQLGTNPVTLTLNGTIAGAGNLRGGNASLIIGGTGSFGTLNPSAALTLANLTINRAVLGTITLGSAVTVTTSFSFSAGDLVLNGKTLSVSGTLALPTTSSNGFITGSTTSAISITGSSISGSLFMNQTTLGTTNALNTLTLNNAALPTLTMGNDLYLKTFTQTKGIIDINDNTLTIITAAAFTSGTTTGSALSNLLINGATIAGTFSMTSGSQTLNNLTLNASTAAQTLKLGTSLTVGGAFSQTKGGVNLNGQTLTLNGSVAFPAAVSTGSVTGSAASNLIINATSISTNTLYLAANPTLFKNFTLNSSGNTVVLGEGITISGTFTQSDGNLNLNGKTATLSGTVALPASSSNGVITGSTTSAISITGSSISGSLCMDQTTLGTTNALATLTLNNAAIPTLKLGGNIVIATTFTHTKGNINLNGNTLTLDGNITFPTALTNGVYIGSSTSGLNIGGTAAKTITNTTIYMDQTTLGSTNILSTLVMNRSTKTLILGNALNITDSICPTAGTLNIGSNVTLIADESIVGHTGRISAVTGTLTSTSITSQVYHSPPIGNTTDWRLLGAAGVTNATFAKWNSSFQITCPSGCSDGDGSAQNSGTPFSSITTYNEPTDAFPAIGGTASTIVSGVGYWVFMGNSYSGTSSSPELISVNGTVQKGTFTWPALTNTNAAPGNTDGDEGYNLIANPYPSPISWDKVYHDALNSAAFTSFPALSTYYIYSPLDQGYIGYNAATSISTPVNGHTITGTIPMGGGFYVVNSNVSSSATLKVSETDKIQSSSSSYIFKQASPNSQANGTSYFGIVVSGARNISRETDIAFNSNSSVDFDAYDTPAMLKNKTLQVTTLIQNKNYFVNTLPSLSRNYTIPIRISSALTSQYTITATHLQNIASNACFILHDKYTNSDYDLRGEPFVLTINDTETVARFELNIIANSIDASGNLQAPNCKVSSSAETKALSLSQKNIEISRDAEGYYVQFNYADKTNAVISVQNLLGEKVVADINQDGVSNNKTYILLGNTSNNVLIISVVTTAGEKAFRKVINQ